MYVRFRPLGTQGKVSKQAKEHLSKVTKYVRFSKLSYGEQGHLSASMVFISSFSIRPPPQDPAVSVGLHACDVVITSHKSSRNVGQGKQLPLKLI